jgi:ABC-type branched-subunit amino acid transport system ATPase component/branched-subunit amino acid ABC-type transport system permease component
VSTQLLQQAALALGSGATVAIAGQGIVQIYRGSGVLNFAHGAFALAGAQTFVWLWHERGVPLAVALGAAVAVGAVLGALTQLLAMRPLQRASQLVRIIATVGVLQVVQQASLLIFGSTTTRVPSFLPRGAIQVGSVNIPNASLLLLGIAIALTLTLGSVMRVTGFGRATQAVAENHLVARAVGRSPERIATSSWAIGGALAGLAGALVVSVGGLAISSILLMAVPAFAAAVLGGFRSYLLTTVGAIAIAIGQGVYTFESVRRDWPPGVAPALPFLVVAIVLTVRSSALPRRDEIVARLPRVARSAPRPIVVAGAGAVGVLVCLGSSEHLGNALVTSVAGAVIGLSLVVVTGLSGQISLAQYAIAGLGALAAARASDLWGWPFPTSLAVGMVAAAASGMVFALPSLRTRGPALAVVTIGLGLAVQQGVLADKDITGGFNGATPVERPVLFGIDLNAIEHPQRYAALVVVGFTVLATAVAVLRASPVGRRLLAVRNNERAAATLGISVAAAKLYAFGLGAAIAGAGGVFMAYRVDAVQYGQFGFLDSLILITVVLIGGIGYVLGPLAGAAMLPGGLVTYLTDDIGDLTRWLVLLAGAFLVVVLAKMPDGITAPISRHLRAGRRRGQAEAAVADGGDDAFAGEPKRLEIAGLRVAFGQVLVLDGVDLVVEPGRVTGLIGANGAGKTTLIDAVSGFIRPAAGAIRLGGQDISGLSPRARAALGIGRCFQSLELFEDLTVRENLLVGTDDIRPHHWITNLVRPHRHGLPPHALAVVAELGLGPALDRTPDELAHGTRHLVGVARALVGRPSLLLLDEPAAGLDPAERAHLGRLIRRVADVGVGVLLVEHDVELVAQVSDRVVAIDFGQPIYDGPPAAVIDDPNVRTAYLGVGDQPLAVAR